MAKTICKKEVFFGGLCDRHKGRKCDEKDYTKRKICIEINNGFEYSTFLFIGNMSFSSSY
jgi:hypothetical protein